MYSTPASLLPWSSSPLSPPRRRIVSESNLYDWSLMSQEDREMLVRDWHLERRQLQMENQRLTKLLDDAHRHIYLLQQKQQLLQRSNDRQHQDQDELASVSSNAGTVKAGSSHKRIEQSSATNLESSTKKLDLLRIIGKFFRRRNKTRDEHEENPEDEADEDCSSMLPMSGDSPLLPSAAEESNDSTVIVKMPSPKAMKRARASFVVGKYLRVRPDESVFDSSTEATSLAEF